MNGSERCENDYYEDHWRRRGGALSKDPAMLEKIEHIMRMIPSDVRSILDLGCGDGAISNALAERYSVTATDLSRQALSYLNPDVPGVAAEAGALPFRSCAFDLVLSSQLLEHVSGDRLPAVTSEMRRVAKNRLFISVPNDEELQNANTFCCSCGRVFHAYLHHHSFTEDRIRDLFPGWNVVGVRICGVLDTPSIGWISALKNRWGRNYFYLPSTEMTCPFCGSRMLPPPRTFLHRGASLALRILEFCAVRIMRRKPKPDWLMISLERGEVH